MVLVTFVLSKKFLSLYLRKKKEKAISDLLFFHSPEDSGQAVSQLLRTYAENIFLVRFNEVFIAKF